MNKFIATIAVTLFGLAQAHADQYRYPRELCKEQQYCVYENPDGKSAATVVDFAFWNTSFWGKVGIARVKKDGESVYINTKGEIVDYSAGSKLRFQNEGALLLPIKIDGKYGFVDPGGNIKINATYDDADEFSEKGLARVKVNDKYGFIGRDGHYIIEPSFEYASSRPINGLIEVRNNDKYGFIGINGKVIVPLIYDELRHDLERTPDAIVVKTGGKYGIINSKGILIASAKYDYLDYPSNGYIKIVIDNKVGYLDSRGQLAIRPIFDSADSFGSNGLAPASLNGGNFGYINKKGEFVIQERFKSARNFTMHFSRGLAKVSLNGREIYITESGNEYNSVVYKTLMNSANKDDFIFKMSFSNKTPQQLYLAAGNLARSGDNYKARLIYAYIIDAYPDSTFAVKASDQLSAGDRADSERDSISRANSDAAQRAYRQCKIEMDSCYSRTNGKGNCYRNCDSLH